MAGFGRTRIRLIACAGAVLVATFVASAALGGDEAKADKWGESLAIFRKLQEKPDSLSYPELRAARTAIKDLEIEGQNRGPTPPESLTDAQRSLPRLFAAKVVEGVRAFAAQGSPSQRLAVYAEEEDFLRGALLAAKRFAGRADELPIGYEDGDTKALALGWRTS